MPPVKDWITEVNDLVEKAYPEAKPCEPIATRMLVEFALMFVQEQKLGEEFACFVDAKICEDSSAVR